MSELPEGWVMTALGTVCTLINGDRGKNYPSKGDFVAHGFPFINAGNLVAGRIEFSTMHYISEDTFARLGSGKVKNGDILYCLRGSLGKTAIVRDLKNAAISSSLVIIRPSKRIHIHYLYYFLISPLGRTEILTHDNGSAQPNLSAKSLKQFRLPLPPLPEQRRIADALDALLARVDACRERLDRVPEVLKRFRRAVLAAATSGELTREWRGSDFHTNTTDFLEIPESWSWEEIGQVALVKGGKRLPKGSTLVSYDTGFPYIKAGQLKNGTVLEHGQEFLRPETHRILHRYTVEEGDAYITIVGACIGDAGIIPRQYHKANLTENAARVSPLNAILGVYISYWLRSPIAQDQISSLIRSGAQGKLSLERIRSFPIPLPPLPEQHEIVRRVEELFAMADRLEARYAAARAAVERLAPAALAKAFRGEL